MTFKCVLIGSAPMNKDVYRFQNSIDFLQFEFARKKIKNPKFSLRAWSSQLKFKNPAFLSQILSRKRKLKLDLAKRISNNLGLSSEEAKYFETLVLLENAKTVEEKNLVHDLLVSIGNENNYSSIPISLDVFKFVADWSHIAILEILNLKDFDGTQKFIELYMSEALSSAQVKLTIERLVRLDLVANTKGKLSRRKDSSILFDANIPSEAVRSYHAQMLQRAQRSIEEQSLEQRDLRSSTLCFKNEDYKKAKQIIAECHKKLSLLSRDRNGEMIYQLNTQLFELIPSTKTGLDT